STRGKKRAAGSSSEAEENNNDVEEPTCRKSKCRKGGSDDDREAPPPCVKGRNKGKAKAIPKTTSHPKVQASAAAQRNAESKEEDKEVGEEDKEEVREEDKEEVREEDDENELGEDKGGEDEIEVSPWRLTTYTCDCLDRKFGVYLTYVCVSCIYCSHKTQLQPVTTSQRLVATESC
ncbi:hypothetical protein H0H87_002458, partial [Tephrocybe sp. NHM501043]